jgi:hypothetical protein
LIWLKEAAVIRIQSEDIGEPDAAVKYHLCNKNYYIYYYQV